MSLYTEYFDTDIETRKIKMTISFNKETVSWATSRPIDKGYRVTCVPVTITTHSDSNGRKYKMEEFGVFTGFNDTLLAIDRQSNKRLEQAKAILQLRANSYLNYFKNKYNMIIPRLENSLNKLEKHEAVS